tara:strand:- start:811 stop:1053 length:243 start_codon:yes stop_codon:yes gene_type:complete
MNEIYRVYSKDGCPYCTKVISVLHLAELKHIEFKLGRDFDKKGFYEEFGQNATFPKVKRDNITLGGCTETVKYLKENNLV